MAKKLVMIISVVLILLGLLGFFNNPILGIFSVNTLHNIVHLVVGILGWIAYTKGEDSSRMFSRTFGVILLLVAILGFVASDFMVGLVNTNTAGNVLHLVVAVLLLWVGFSGSRASSANNMPM